MKHVRYRFGAYSLDLAKRELQRDGQPVALPARVFECLTYLIEHRDRAVHRDQLVQAVFGRADVSDAQMGQIVLRARRTIGDDGQEQRAIRTIPRYGFSWVAPVTVEDADEPAAPETPSFRAAETPAEAPAVASAMPAAPAPRASRRFPPWLLLAVGLAGLLAGSLAWTLARISAPGAAAGENYMVLPVQAHGPGDIAWARLGLMELIADRLRRAGLPVLSSEATLSSLARQDALTARVRQPPGQVTGWATYAQGQWQVSLEVLDRERLARRGEARHANLVDAARLATDRLLAALGRELPAGGSEPPGLAERLLRAQSAMLANELDTARRILSEAPELQRNQPQLRYRLAQVDFRAGEFARGLAAVDALLADPRSRQDPLFHGRLLNARGAMLVRLNRFADAERSFDEAVRRLQGSPYASEWGHALNGRAITHTAQGRFDRALIDLGLARMHLLRAGDRLAVARVDANLGNVEMDRDRPAAALGYFRAAAEDFERLGAVNELAGARSMLVGAQLLLLENQAALAESERLYALRERLRDPAARTRAVLGHAEALIAVGRLREARDLLLAPEAAQPVPGEGRRREFLLMQLAWSGGDARSAALLAEHALQGWPAEEAPQLRAWTRLRWLQAALAADLPRPPTQAAGDTLPDLLARALGHGAHAAAADRDFRTALARAEQSGVPADIAEAVAAYASWLLQAGRADEAGALVGRVAPWAERDFPLALLQLRLLRQTGQGGGAAWRAALEQARRLAGERAIPADLALEGIASAATAHASR